MDADLQVIDLDEDLSPKRSFPSSLEGLAGNPDSPSLNISPFCSSGHHHQYSHTLRPNLSLSLSCKAQNLFIKSNFPQILHHSVWYSSVIHEYLIFPSDSFVTNFDVSLNCHKFHIFSILLDFAKFSYYGNSCQQHKKAKLWLVRNWSEIGIQLSGKVDFLQTRTLWSFIGCLRGGLC